MEHLDVWGSKTLLGQAGPGDLFAETYACLPDEPLRVSVVAAENGEALFLETGQLLQCGCEPWRWKLTQNLLRIAARKNLGLAQRSLYTAPKTIRGRITAYFSVLARQNGSLRFTLPFDRQQLADYLGGPPISFTGNSYAALSNLASLEEVRSWMCEILNGFANELAVSRATKNEPLIEKAIAYLHANLLKNPHTEEVCSYLGLSKSYFSTYFKNKTSLNFRDYLLDLKISYAQEQLKHPDITAGDVAILLGYEDYRSFSRAFKTRTGLTPSDYQKQYTGEGRR